MTLVIDVMVDGVFIKQGGNISDELHTMTLYQQCSRPEGIMKCENREVQMKFSVFFHLALLFGT